MSTHHPSLFTAPIEFTDEAPAPVANLHTAAALCKKLEEIVTPLGLHVALAGGCLTKDGDRKDVDVWFYRHTPGERIEGSKVLRRIKEATQALEVSTRCVAPGYRRRVAKFKIDGVNVDLFLDLLA